MKLDKIDNRILYELDKNCRMPFTEIGEIIRKSPQYVKYRVERLQQEGIIKSASIIVDLPENYSEILGFIKLQGADILEEKKLLDFLFKMPEAYKLYYCDGIYDIVVSFIVKSHESLNSIKESLFLQFPSISSISFSPITQSEIYTKKYLISNPEHETIIRKSNTKEINLKKEKITDEVLDELSKNPFGTLLDISQNLKISYDKVKYLFRKEQPYLGSRLLLSDFLVKKTLLFLDVKSNIEKIKSYASSYNNIVSVDSIIGDYNLLLSFEAIPEKEQEKETIRVIKEFLYNFKDSINSHEKLTILNTYKWRWIHP